MARDPALTLVEVQTILRHAHLSTTALYTAVRLDDLLDQLDTEAARRSNGVSLRLPSFGQIALGTRESKMPSPASD